MDFRKITLILTLAVLSVAQDEVKNPSNVVAELKLFLREEKIPSIINYLLNNSIETHQITTEDIIKLSKLDQYNQNDLVQVFNYFNISKVYTVDNLETLFTALNIPFNVFYRNFTDTLPLTIEQVNDVLNALSIPPTFWQYVSFGFDKETYNVLREGIYDEEHVNNALEAAGKSATEVYTNARDLVKDQVLQMDATRFMSFLKENGWARSNAFHIYKALNITTSDVYQVEKFKQIFTNISDSLNDITNLGVFTGPKNLTLHQTVYENLSNKVDGILVRIEANGVEVIQRQTNCLGPNIVEVATASAGADYIEIVESYNSSENCAYITFNNGQIRVSDVVIEDLSFVKGEEVFILGAPLICEGRLYGLAREENETAIIFDGFYTEESPRPEEEDDGHGNFINRGFWLSSSFFTLTFNVVIALTLF